MKKSWLGILLIIATILAIILNFNSALQGRSAALLDCIVTVVYVCVWAIIFTNAIKHNEYNLIFPSIVFWGITLLTTIVVILINVYDLTINLAVPFVIVFLTPLYGVRILGASYIFALLLMALIATIFVAYGLYSVITIRKKTTDK